MKKTYLFLANGFEEVEALTVVDILRRADITCTTVSITGEDKVTSSHGITVLSDRLFEDGSLSDADMLILPGGSPGFKNLLAHEGLKELLFSYNAEKKYIAAICGAPSVLGAHGLLNGREATCYPGIEDQLTGATYLKKSVVEDGHFITSRGVGTALDFAISIVMKLAGMGKACEIAESVLHIC
ncbi:MAG: DJ-1/PfpI family protein [Lachnospiraceae bacterium]|nr:DJ-1/PfpI family protein [Lachnospiraceae bacterium]